MRWLVLLIVAGCGRGAATELCQRAESKVIVKRLEDARRDLARLRDQDLPEPMPLREGTRPIVRLHQIVGRLARVQRDAFFDRLQQLDDLEAAIEVARGAWIDGRGTLEATAVLRARIAAFEVVLAPWWAELERARVQTAALRPQIARRERASMILLGRSTLEWIQRQQASQNLDEHRFDRLRSALTDYEACR